jgi:hypothetical protein
VSNVEETLAWEAQWRPRAGLAAIIGALAGIAGGVLLAVTWGGRPTEDEGFVSLPESLAAATNGTEPRDPSLEVRGVDYLGDHFAQLTISTILSVIGAVGALLALTYLFRAARARNPDITRAVGWSVAAALALYPLGRGVREMSQAIEYMQFADASTRTPGEVRDLAVNGVTPAATLVELLGAFALALAFVLVSMNAMRVGLLTRFMGILGVVVGALAVFQLDAPQIVRGLWLVFLGLLLLGRYPRGAPPAWETGRAEPWPTQQELRERRDAVRAEHGVPAESAAAAEAEHPDGPLLQPGDEGYVPGAARRKRKKRR